ncbi:UNVERIFIED_CONTAM: hypothetical protein Cloal_1148 [Acetivibrio alkalicellulosi]
MLILSKNELTTCSALRIVRLIWAEGLCPVVPLITSPITQRLVKVENMDTPCRAINAKGEGVQLTFLAYGLEAVTSVTGNGPVVAEYDSEEKAREVLKRAAQIAATGAVVDLNEI